VTFDLSHANLMINNDILIKTTQIFMYFNYSLKLVRQELKYKKRSGGSIY